MGQRSTGSVIEGNYIGTDLNGTGGALSPSERNQLVSELSSGAKNRAQVLRAVAEDSDLARNEFNKVFVLMQYFGLSALTYKRRNLNSAGHKLLW